LSEPVKKALPEFAIPWRDVLLHVQDARKRVPPPHKRNTDWQSVRPAELYSADCMANSSSPCADQEAAAGYKPAGRTGQRPVFRI
jgi:virulence-associated protein VagC